MHGFAQNFSLEEQHQIDSLNKIITNPTSHDTSLAGAYVSLSEILYVSNIEALKTLNEKAKLICEKTLAKSPSFEIKKSLLFSLANALNNIGYVYDNQGNIPLALKYYYTSLKINKDIDNKEGIAGSLSNIGNIHETQGNIYKALEYHNKSLKIREEIGDKEGIAFSLNNIGYLYDNQGDTSKALEYYHKSLKINEEIENKRGIAFSLNNIGYIYLTKKDISKALEYYNQSFKIREDIGDKKGIAINLNNIATVYCNQGDTSKALEYYNKSFKIRVEIGDKGGIVNSLNNIGYLEFKKNELIKAKLHLQTALDLAQEIGSPKLILGASNKLSMLFEKQGKNMKALEMFKLYIQMKDSINNEETLKATAQQQAKYEYEKQKAIDDAAHDKQIAVEKEAKAKQKVITYATAGSLGLVIIFLVFVFNRLQVTKKQKIVIEKQKVEVEAQKEVVELAHHELEEKNKEILDSITYAKRIQNAILPSAKVVKEYLQDSFILYKPKDIVAGDFYWLESPSPNLPEGKGVSPPSGESEGAIILFAAADCTGHGVPGAMVSVVCNNGLNRSVREFGLTDPGEILNKTREIVIAEFEKSEDEVKDGMDIALCSLKLEDGGWKLKYAGANNPLWIIRKEEIIETKANKQPIGQCDNPEPYTTHIFELQKEDSIYIFSDGYVDQFGGEKGKKFKAQAFRELLLSIQDKSMEEQQVIINEAFENWKGNLEQIDDVCVIGVRI